MQPTWTPHEKHGQLTAKSDLPDTVFAFPKQRKEPLTDASTFAMRSRDSIRSSTFPMTIVLWPSRTSRRRQNIMT